MPPKKSADTFSDGKLLVDSFTTSFWFCNAHDCKRWIVCSVGRLSSFIAVFVCHKAALQRSFSTCGWDMDHQARHQVTSSCAETSHNNRALISTSFYHPIDLDRPRIQNGHCWGRRGIYDHFDGAIIPRGGGDAQGGWSRRQKNSD